jgi:hypothetical protein
MIDKYIIYCICLWHFHVNQINSDHAHFPRKRRRQLYHAKKDALKFKKPMSAKTKLIKKRSTKDAGVYTKQINATRRVVTIKDKLAVVDFYEKLQAEKMAAQAILREPRLVNVTRKRPKNKGANDWKRRRWQKSICNVSAGIDSHMWWGKPKSANGLPVQSESIGRSCRSP